MAEDAGTSTGKVGLDGLEAELAMNFDAEMVQRERDAGTARTQKLQDLVDQQDAVLKGILQKMADEGDDGGGSPSHSPIHGNNSRFLSQHSTSVGSLADLSQASSTFEQHAVTVASQILTRQEKLDTFQRRRRDRAEEAKRGFDRRQVEAEAAEQRFAERQRAIADEHRRKAFAMQQRRNEQQKTFKESQREEDRICDEYYDERKQSPRGGGRGHHGSPKGKTQNLSTQTETTEESDIWKHTTQSHAIYVDTVDKWRQQVKENDQRNEAFRRRVLKAARMDDRAGKGSNLSRRKNSVSGPPGLAKAASLGNSQGSLNSDMGAETIGAPQGLEATADISRSAPNLASPRWTGPPLTVALWTRRWMKTQEYAYEMDIEATAKQLHDEQVLKQGRTRICNNNADIILQCQERSEVWRQRNDAATARRKKLAVTSDAELKAKMEAFDKRRAALEKDAKEQLEENKEQRLHRLQEVKANYSNKVEDNEKNYRARWDEQTNSLAERYAHRLEGYVKKAESGGPYYEMAREAKARKQQYDQDFKDKSRREAEMKSNHHKNLTGEMRYPVKVAFSPKGVKALRNTHGKGRTPKSLDGTLLPSDFDGDSGLVDETQAEMLESALVETQSLPRLQPSGSAKQVPSSTGGAREGRRPSMLDLSEDDGTENELLQDLETRSAKWLKDLRRKNAQNVKKMF